MAISIISTAMLSSYLGNVLIGKLTSKAGNSFCDYVFNNKNSDAHISLDEYIRRIDIKEKIIISEAFIDSIVNDNFKYTQIITSLRDIIIDIKALLQLIKDKKNKHSRKYFKSYRSLSLHKEQARMTTYDAILSRRLDYFVKLISIQ